MKKSIKFSLYLLPILVEMVQAQQNDITKNIISSDVAVYERFVPKLRLKTNFQDTVFHTHITRVTNAKAEDLPGLFPQYSKRQAWNADETRLIIFSDDGSVRLYDGQTYEFKKVLEGVGGEDVFWHPIKVSTIIFVDENKLCSYDIVTEEKTIIKSFPEFSFINTRGEGNLSDDGSKYAFVGQIYDERSQSVIYKQIVLFDLVQRKVISQLPLPEGIENFDWVSISPSGNFIVIDYADNESKSFHGLEVYNTDFQRLWQKPLGAGHSDLGFDENGDEVLIMDVYDENINKTVIKKFRLENGNVTDLLHLSPFFDLHISCRNELNKGWCFISTFNYVGRLISDKSNWLPFENEIFALKMDGSAEVKRLFHHRSRRYTPITPDSDTSIYWAEPHATVNRKGNRIAWGSNWGIDVKSVNSIDLYIGTF